MKHHIVLVMDHATKPTSAVLLTLVKMVAHALPLVTMVATNARVHCSTQDTTVKVHVSVAMHA